jgi:hypothetical protein
VFLPVLFPLILFARILSIPSQILTNLWNTVHPNRQHLGQVTVLEQEKPVKMQTLPRSDVMWQFLQWAQTVVPCCLLAYRGLGIFQLFASLQFLRIRGECSLIPECQLLDQTLSEHGIWYTQKWS